LRKELILASKSPQRSALLRAHGIAFTVAFQDAPEDGVCGAPREIVLQLAGRKARAVAAAAGFVLGADTLVVIDGAILGKPADADDAMRMLRMLSGRTHEVLTGLCLIDAQTRACVERVVRTAVTFRTLSDREIRDYAASGDPLSRAGAYGIQGEAGAFVSSIDGSYENVVGLPVDTVIDMLALLGG
jgi:septum formation protein